MFTSYYMLCFIIIIEIITDINHISVFLYWPQDVNTQWNTTSLSSDHDDKSKEKFRKLMGIKQESGDGVGDDDQDLKQKELFEKLDKEYQFARMATHTHRGVGLGFGSSGYQPPAMW